jgi:hypothetical protein
MKEKLKEIQKNFAVILIIVMALTISADLLQGNYLSIESFLWATSIFIPLTISMFLVILVFRSIVKELNNWKLLAIVTLIVSGDFIMQLSGLYNIDWLFWLPVSNFSVNSVFFASLFLFTIEVSIFVLIIKLYQKLGN